MSNENSTQNVPMPPDWAIAHVVRQMAARGPDSNSLTEMMQGHSILRKAIEFQANLDKGPNGWTRPL